ncbi:hypothetical protein HMPREF9189_0077 [Streptococcus sp. oral taxon 071 str. 73H25AP]|uniref:hypothetical protein n=1 Tax=Streptococcus sp. oral taxon 071 TaxID=712630 RepID=UPI0001E0FF8E|nr:hypothetical protein [Streptococcus sp. oral taxon 071]EFM36265.1 hypothetical protein HMPREF9189_0077 [Streptococcus sp. oral taxon 071 str. 73H25AP]
MKLILKMIILVSLWYLTIFILLLLKRIADFYSGKVVKTNKLKVATLQVLLYQLEMILLFAKFIFNKVQIYFEEKNTQKRKMIVLQNVVHHLNQNLKTELGIKIVSPATSNGIDIWIYLANNLKDADKTLLEDYFSGVLSKYTAEFALDILIIKQNAGAGWIATFDIKPVAEATYNRMARASEVTNEDKYDEDIDIW